MYLKNEDKIAEISHLIPHSLNLYGVNFEDLTFEQYLVLSKFKKHE